MEYNRQLVTALVERGWAIAWLDSQSLVDEERFAVANWETTFAHAFALSPAEKEAVGLYRNEYGISIGYRVDNEREFFETRIRSGGSVDPNFPNVQSYDAVVRSLYSVLNKAALMAFEGIAELMQIDHTLFLGITDISSNGVLPASTMTNKETGEQYSRSNLSSSLLRICKYQDDIQSSVNDSIKSSASGASQTVFTAVAKPSEADGPTAQTPAATGNIWFGAHTDSSLLTLSLCSSTPGLDIVDQKENKWVMPELLVSQGRLQEGATEGGNDIPCVDALDDTTAVAPIETEHGKGKLSQGERATGKIPVIIFVGEFLQILTKGRFKAAVHRVRDIGTESLNREVSSATGTGTVSAARRQREEGRVGAWKDSVERRRISCPYLVRGKHSAVLDIRNAERYAHPGGIDAVSDANMPDFDGMSVKMLTKLLDIKRQRCFKEHGSAEGRDWVLSAYPVPPLPPDDCVLRL